MNYNDDDELERMRARNRRGTRRGPSASSPAAGRQVPPPRNGKQGYGSRSHYDEEYYYDEEFGQEEYGRDAYSHGERRQNRHDQAGYDYGNDYGYRNREGYGDEYDYGDGEGYRDEYGYVDEAGGIILEDEPEYRQPNRRIPSSARPSRTGKAARTAAGSGAYKGKGSARQAADTAQSGQRRQYDDIHADSNGRSRNASGRRGQGQMAKKRKKRGLKSILLILLAAFIAYGAWLFIHRPTGIWNIAVFGVDSRDGNTKNALADVQMICSIDRSTGEIKLVSVYRDTYLKINSEGTYHKINEAYFKGGQKQGVAALEENLDIKIDDYATFNWKSVAEAINILGGIDIDITPAEFKYINAFITETVNSTGIGSVQLAQAGPNHLDGVQAVAYSRLRLMDTDFQRTERQRKVVMLALEKAKQADAATLTSLATYMIPQISTSVGVNDVIPLVKDIKKYHIGDTAGFPFSRQTMRVGRMDCVIPTTLESNVVMLHQFLYGEDTSYRPSSAVKKISAHISEETGLYEEGKAAPSGGGSSGGSSGGASGGGQAPVQTAPPETVPETTVEESTQEETTKAPETTEAETTEPEETEEVGPGVTKPSKEPDKPEEGTTAPEEGGPGAQDDTKPAVKPTQPPSKETSTQPPEAGTTGPGGPAGSENNPGGPGEAGPGV